MRPMEIGIALRKQQLPQGFHSAHRGVEFAQVLSINSDKTYDVRVPGRAHPMTGLRPTRAGNIRVGDQVHVGHLHGSPDLPFIFAVGGAATGGAGQPNDMNPPPPALVTALWPTSQGNLRLDCLCEQSQTVPDLGDTGVPFITLDAPGLPPLGLILFDNNGSSAIAVYYPALVATQYQNRISAYAMDSLAKLWDTDIGAPYSYPSSFQDLAVGLRQPWLSYDPQYKQFWAIGWGSGTARNTVYCVDVSGSLLGYSSQSFRLVQNTVGAGRFVKGWHSSRPSTYREGGDDALIRAFRYRETQIRSLWTLDPQTCLPSYQIATSSDGQTDVSPKNPRGRWPVDASRRQICLWVSGSKKLSNSNADRMIQLQYTGGTWGGYSQEDDVRTKDHACCLCGVDVDTGAIKWQRNWQYSPSHQMDTDHIAFVEATLGAVVGGAVGSLSVSDYYPASGDTAWAPQLTYVGAASQDSLLFSPPGATLNMPACQVDEEPPGSGNYVPNYSVVPTPIVQLKGVDWGGSGVWSTPNMIGIWSGPKYDFWAPGHPILCPLPLEDMERGPIYEWPTDSPDYVRLDNVGGTLIQDALDNYWQAHVVQGNPICRGANRALVQYQGQSETFIPAATADQCGSWTDRKTYWNVSMLPDIVHTMKLMLCRTGPGGELFFDTDISQYATRSNSSISWPIKSNCYQVAAFPYVGRIVVVRDWHPETGRQEPYPVIEIREYDSPSTLIARVPLLDNLDDYSFEPNPDEEPGVYVDRRRWDHYVDATELMTGRGSGVDSNWIRWHQTVYNREAGDTEINQVLLQFDSGGSHTITRRQTAAGETSRAEGSDSHAIALGSNKQAWPYGNDTIRVRDNT